MSLIDEALKRARDQALPAAAGEPVKAAPRRPVDPWAYAPLPHGRRRSTAARWILFVAFGILVVGAAARIWTRPDLGIGTLRKGPPVPTAVPPAAVSQPLEATADPVGPTPAPEPSPSARAGIAAPERPRRPRPAPAASETLIAPPGQTGGAPPAPPPVPRPAGQAVDGRTYVGAVVAPNGKRVELGGIVYSETNASALLNGRILPVGGFVEGLTVTSIEEDRVELSGDGITIHIALR